MTLTTLFLFPEAVPAPSPKSADAYRTISEVAEALDVPQHVLRFWETKFPKIKPLKRSGGRRYYRPEDMELLRDIRHYLYDRGYTIKGVQRLLAEPRQVAEQAVQVPMPFEPEEAEAKQPETGDNLRTVVQEALAELADLKKLLQNAIK